MTARCYPFLTRLCLFAQPVIWQVRLPLPLPVTVPEGGQEQIQPLNHITQKEERHAAGAHEKCGLLK